MTEPLNPEFVYKFSRVSAPDNLPYKPHPNSWLMTKAMFSAIGGYDERLAGWYGTDGDFVERILPIAPVVMLKHPLIRVPRSVIPDASTTTLGRKSRQDFEAIQGLRKANAGTPPLNLSFPWEKVYPVDSAPEPSAED